MCFWWKFLGLASHQKRCETDSAFVSLFLNRADTRDKRVFYTLFLLSEEEETLLELF